MHTSYVNSNIALKLSHFAAPVRNEPQRTSSVLSKSELREIVLQMVG